MTIYILTEGSYSDYHIVAVYSSKELAEEAQKHCPDSVIEEYELDSLKIPEHPPGHTAWVVNINTKTNSISWTNHCDVLNGFEPNEHYFDRGGLGQYNAFVVKCWARDEEHAEKIALDKFYQWKWEKQMETEKI